jgi:glycosyltransferase involved in cell wall biosynthesis
LKVSRHMPKISVVTLSRNREKTIAKTIESVLAQTFQPYEYIILDGASTDKTVAVAHRYKDRFLAKGVTFKIISEPDRGLYDAMSKAVTLITGEWLHYLNSDDWYHDSSVLEQFRDVLQQSRADVVYGDILMVDAKDGSIVLRENSKSGEQIKKGLRKGCCIPQPATFYRTTVFNPSRLFDLSLPVSADWEYFLYIARRGAAFQYHPVVLTCFLYGDGISTTNALKTIRDNIRIHLRYRAFNSMFIKRILTFLLIKMRGLSKRG